jgi:hypothetical protein
MEAESFDPENPTDANTLQEIDKRFTAHAYLHNHIPYKSLYAEPQTLQKDEQKDHLIINGNANIRNIKVPVHQSQ